MVRVGLTYVQHHEELLCHMTSSGNSTVRLHSLNYISEQHSEYEFPKYSAFIMSR